MFSHGSQMAIGGCGGSSYVHKRNPLRKRIINFEKSLRADRTTPRSTRGRLGRIACKPGPRSDGIIGANPFRPLNPFGPFGFSANAFGHHGPFPLRSAVVNFHQADAGDIV